MGDADTVRPCADCGASLYMLDVARKLPSGEVYCLRCVLDQNAHLDGTSDE